MTVLSTALVLVASAIHAFWNYIAKRATSNNAVFVWLASALEIITLGPLAIWTLVQGDTALGLPELGFIAGSAVLHVVYFLLLTGGYRVGDLSVVYPLARGVGPLFVTAGAILLLGESPTALAWGATLLIVVGVLALTGDPRLLRSSAALPGVVYGLVTALSIAGYSLWDSVAVTRLHVSPVVYLWGVGAVRAILLLPYALTHRGAVRDAWAKDRRKALLVAALSPGGYVLILIAVTLSPVSYVSAMRSISILLGVMMGAQLLNEGDIRRRVVGALAMVAGVGLLALA